MSTSDLHIRSAITQVAADWYMAHRFGPLSDAERAEFLAWLKSSPVHIEEYLGVAALERVLPQATEHPQRPLAALTAMARDDVSDGVVDLMPSAPRVNIDRTTARSARRFWRPMATLGILSIGGIWLLWGTLTAPGSTPAKVYRTAHGEQGTWTLADGSTLRLDTDTAVIVHFSSAGRSLELDHGQLWVAVAHDVHRPLRVQAGLTEVVAVGTEFDVYRTPDSTVVTVLNGQVAVARSDAALRRLRVAAGQQVRVVQGVLPEAPTTVDRRQSIAWLERRILFEHRPLGEVADEFNRYNATSFTIADAALRNMPISGAFAADDIESFVAFLESLDGVHVDRSPKSLRVYLSSPQAPR
jgi:transmembrane sensor